MIRVTLRGGGVPTVARLVPRAVLARGVRMVDRRATWWTAHATACRG